MSGPQPELERPAHHVREAQRYIDELRGDHPQARLHALLAIAGELRELNSTLKKLR